MISAEWYQKALAYEKDKDAYKFFDLPLEDEVTAVKTGRKYKSIDLATAKKMYRSLSLALHPDKHGDDQARAVVTFQALGNAYDALVKEIENPYTSYTKPSSSSKPSSSYTPANMFEDLLRGIEACDFGSFARALPMYTYPPKLTADQLFDLLQATAKVNCRRFGRSDSRDILGILYMMRNRLGLTSEIARRNNNEILRQYVTNENLTLVEFLHTKLGLTADDARQSQVLINAASNGFFEIVKYLHTGFGLNAHDARKSNNLALKLAAEKKHYAIIKYFFNVYGLTDAQQVLTSSKTISEDVRNFMFYLSKRSTCNDVFQNFTFN